MNRPLEIRRLGRVEYADGLQLMEAHRASRLAGQIPDTLLLLEHSPVFTIGRGGSRADVLLSERDLAGSAIEVVETDRGGEVTYHGPGQLVGYPIIDLNPDRRDVRRYVRDLEEVMIRSAADAGVRAGRVPGLIGVWLAPDADPPAPGPARKLGAIGVHLSRWVTTHGFALNINPDLSFFGGIVPCGIRDRGVTSLERELGAPLSWTRVGDSVEHHFAEVFERAPVRSAATTETVQVNVVRRGAQGAEVLALRRSSENGGFWQPITGWVEEGESAAAAAVRELREETGLSEPVQSLEYVHEFLKPGAEPLAIARESAFVSFAAPSWEPRLSSEHDAFAWLGADGARSQFPFAGLRRGALLALDADVKRK